MEWDNEGGQWGTDKKKYSRKAQNRKSTEKAAKSNGTSSKATDTTAKEAKNMKHKLLASISAMNLRWIPMVEATLDWLKK